MRSINGILGKVGSSAPIGLTLSLIASNCNPVLLYGIESMALNNAESKSLQYPYNSAFTKVFSSFDAKIITQCQFYSGYLPLSYLADLRWLNFYNNICSQEYHSSAGILYRWFGSAECNAIAEKYNMDKILGQLLLPIQNVENI